MIYDVKKVAQGEYIINHSVIVFDIMPERDGVHYKINYDDLAITSAEADEIGNEFIERAMENFFKDENMENFLTV